jgi:hypothetical protein
MTALWIAGALVALALIAVGIVALAAPHAVTRGYGIHVEGLESHGYVRATGIRDLVIGVVLAIVVYLQDFPLIVVLAAAGIVLSVADFFIAYHAGGKRLHRAHGFHAAGALAFVLVLAMALFAIGR